MFCLYPIKLISAFSFILLIYSINSIGTKCFYSMPFHPLTQKPLFKYQFYSEQFLRAEFSVGFKGTFENIQQILLVCVYCFCLCKAYFCIYSPKHLIKCLYKTYMTMKSTRYTLQHCRKKNRNKDLHN